MIIGRQNEVNLLNKASERTDMGENLCLFFLFAIIRCK